MNLGELLEHWSATLGTSVAAGTSTRTFGINAANMGVLDILRRTRINVDHDDALVTAGSAEYDLPQTFMRVLMVEAPASDGAYQQLQRLPLDRVRRLLRTGASEPVRAFAVEGQLLVLYPRPSSVYSIRFHYVPRPTKMAVDADDPAAATFGRIPEEHHMALATYMLWLGARRKGDTTSRNGGDYRQEYLEEHVREIKRSVNRMGGRLGPAPVGTLNTRVYEPGYDDGS